MRFNTKDFILDAVIAISIILGLLFIFVATPIDNQNLDLTGKYLKLQVKECYSYLNDTSKYSYQQNNISDFELKSKLYNEDKAKVEFCLINIK